MPKLRRMTLIISDAGALVIYVPIIGHLRCAKRNRMLWTENKIMSQFLAPTAPHIVNKVASLIKACCARRTLKWSSVTTEIQILRYLGETDFCHLL